MLLRVLTAAETLPTSPLLAELMSGGVVSAQGRGEGVSGVGRVGLDTAVLLCMSLVWWGVVLVGPVLLRITSPAPLLAWS